MVLCATGPVSALEAVCAHINADWDHAATDTVELKTPVSYWAVLDIAQVFGRAGCSLTTTREPEHSAAAGFVGWAARERARQSGVLCG